MCKRVATVCYPFSKAEGEVNPERINQRLRRLVYYRGCMGMAWRNTRDRVGEMALF